MTPRLIAFCGYARAGKDAFAELLVADGWKIHNFGHVIKDFYSAYLEGRNGTSIGDVVLQIEDANPGVSEDAVIKFVNDVLLPYEQNVAHIGGIDAFTEDDTLKTLIRPVLEHGGDIIYGHVLKTYFAEIDARLARGERVVNTRLVRIPEGLEWALRGGSLFEVDRKDWPAASEWEAKGLEELRASGLIDGVLKNHGTLANWQAFASGWVADQIASGAA